MKHLRTIALSALVLSLIAFGLPTQDALAYLSRRAVSAAHRRGNHRYCNHTRGWWRRYRQRQRQRLARAAMLRRQRREAVLAAARARAAAGIEPAYAAGPKTAPAAADAARTFAPTQTARPARSVAPAQADAARTVATAASAHAATEARTKVTRTSAAPSSASRAELYRASAARAAAPGSGAEPSFRKTPAAVAPAVQGPRNPFDFAVPQTWRLTGANAQGTLKFAVADRTGRETGTATLSPMALAGSSAALDVITPRTRLLGGVALPVLRRTIIDRMVVEGGWVTNDMERVIDGRQVYVVVAQTGTSGVARESWTFYFTEIDGRLYSLATNSPVEFSSPVAVGSEQLLATLRAGSAASLTAGARR